MTSTKREAGHEGHDGPTTPRAKPHLYASDVRYDGSLRENGDVNGPEGHRRDHLIRLTGCLQHTDDVTAVRCPHCGTTTRTAIAVTTRTHGRQKERI